MQIPQLPVKKQPDVVPDQTGVPAPSLWLYVFLFSSAVLLIKAAFWNKADWPALFLNLAASLIAAIIVLIVVDRRLRDSELGQMRRLPLLMSPRHRQIHAYTRAFLSELKSRLKSKVVPDKNIEELAHRAQHSFVLVGEARAGKSTRLQMLAARLADRFLKHETPRAPILLPLRLWQLNQSVNEALFEHVDKFWPVWRSSLRSTLQQGKAVVMFDGLDDLSEAQAERFSKEFALLRQTYPTVTWIISTLPGLLPEVDDLPEVYLEPLTREEMLSLTPVSTE